MKPMHHDGSYFNSMDEADEWLEFDAHEEEIEDFAYAWPDTFTEWQRWRRLYNAGVQQLD